VNNEHPLRPFVAFSAKDCEADTFAWSYDGMGVIRKMDVAGLTGTQVKLNKDNVRCVFNDTSAAYVLFNDCNGGRGYYLRIPFNKTANIGRSNRALNNFDPKYDVDDNLLAYIDPANILVVEMKTGKTALMTFGTDIKPDYANLHNTIDSVSIKPDRIWARYKFENEWKELEKKIVLK
jgi:hypothetical protein